MQASVSCSLAKKNIFFVYNLNTTPADFMFK